MKTYNKNEVIEKGKITAKVIRALFFAFGLLCLGTTIALIVRNEKEWIVGVIMSPIFLVLPFFFKFDYLKFGCDRCKSEIQSKINNRNYEMIKGRTTEFTDKYFPHFESEELYSLLKENEEVQYYDEEDVYISCSYAVKKAFKNQPAQLKRAETKSSIAKVIGIVIYTPFWLAIGFVTFGILFIYMTPPWKLFEFDNQSTTNQKNTTNYISNGNSGKEVYKEDNDWKDEDDDEDDDDDFYDDNHHQEPYEEIDDHLKGKKNFHEMSDDAQDQFLEDYDGD